MRASDPKKVSEIWESYGLPETMVKEDFLDVGCWGGGFLLEAINRGADIAVGVDSVRTLAPYVERSLGGTVGDTDRTALFYQMDIYSPHWFSLPRFDHVLCAGVLYHVPDPVGLLHRLKAVLKDKGFLYLETGLVQTEESFSIMEYMAGNMYDNNFSNWFFPNKLLLETLLPELGFKILSDKNLGKNRYIYVLALRDGLPHKTLPRKEGYMICYE